MKALKDNDLVIKRDNDKWSVRYKQYLYDEDGEERTAKPYSVLKGPYSQEGTNSIVELFGDNKVFDFPKPPQLIAHLLSYGWRDKDDSIVLDFFAGSGATAQAVMDLNASDGGKRRFILVQLPQPLDSPMTLADGSHFETIDDITRERVRRAGLRPITKAQPELSADSDRLDRGFRAFRLAPSHFLPWTDDTGGDAAALADKLRASAQGVLDQADPQGILFEVLLKSGFPLSVPVETREIGGLTTFRVDGGRLLVCLSMRLTDAGLRALIAEGPERIVVLDDGFGGNDALKANIAQQVKQHNALHKDRPIDLRTV